MELIQVTERVWYYPFEKKRDRPILGYIRGDHWSVAVDAGHSEAHTREFYDALREAGLPLPSVTVLTHWHWDHTFGMHAVNGLCIANERTVAYLEKIRERILSGGRESFLSIDRCIRHEYADDRPIIVTLPDIVFSDTLTLEAGNCPVRLTVSVAPHTDDATLVYVPTEKVLFLGDAASGVFPTWEKNPALCAALADTVAALDVEICLESHHTPQSKQEIIANLRETT